MLVLTEPAQICAGSHSKKGMSHMEYSTGKENLLKVFYQKNISGMKKRYSFPKLMKYLQGGRDTRICALYGLRRTGKTTMMAQAACELQDYDSICWVHCEEGDSIQDVKNVIKNNPSCRYFFLDEVTRLENFTSASSILADKFVAEDGKKIVMAGTDSLGFSLAFSTELFDRAHIIHTTYIPFAEYRYLLGNDRDIDDYIQYGGTLTDGEVFYNSDPALDYTNDAIAVNIQHSLEMFRNGGSFGALLPFYASGELTTFINKLVEMDNRTFLAGTVNKMFRSHDMGKLRSNLERDKNLDTDTSPLKNKQFLQEIRDALLIKEPLLNKATPEAMRDAKRYLERLDVIFVVPGSKEQEVIFMQPGLRYSQVQREMRILEQSELLGDFEPSLRQEFCRRLDETVKGAMMEDIIFVQLSLDKELKDQFLVTKYRDSAGKHEFDLVLIDKNNDKAYLFEIKHSDKFLPYLQARHLIDKEACTALERDLHVKIAGKAVVYRGVNNDSCTQGVLYRNINTLLEKPKTCIQDMKDFLIDDQKSSVRK